MANLDEEEIIEELEVIQEDADNAKDFTGGIVMTTTLILLVALVTAMMALGDTFHVGPFKPNPESAAIR